MVQILNKSDWRLALGPLNAAVTAGAPAYWEKTSELPWLRAGWARRPKKRSVDVNVTFMVTSRKVWIVVE